MAKSLISIRDFSKEEILHVLETAREFEQNRVQNFLEGKVIASLFFEPSTRTRLSFETAINRLGAKVIGFSDASNTSQSKGETLKDTIKMVNNYVDMIVMRHPLEGSSRYASEVATVPVVKVFLLVEPFYAAMLMIKMCLRGAGDTRRVMYVSYGCMGFFRVGCLFLWTLFWPETLSLVGIWLLFTIDLAVEYVILNRVLIGLKWARRRV